MGSFAPGLLVYIMNNEVHSGINGTQTEQNLNNAFAGEARSHMRYRLYADAAKRNGDVMLSKLLSEVAENEKEHAELWMEYMGELEADEKNLENLISGERYENTVLYPEYAKIADEEGFYEIADKMRMAANAEKHHEKTLQEYLTQMQNGTRYTGNENTEWVCTNCGYTYEGAQPPERCPLCSHPRNYFTKITD